MGQGGGKLVEELILLRRMASFVCGCKCVTAMVARRCHVNVKPTLRKECLVMFGARYGGRCAWAMVRRLF